MDLFFFLVLVSYTGPCENDSIGETIGKEVATLVTGAPLSPPLLAHIET
jgi:hypothetical protein